MAAGSPADPRIAGTPSRIGQRALAQLLRQHPCRRLVVGDVEDPLHGAGDDLEAPRQLHLPQRLRGGTLVEGGETPE